jgi:hypothetical protein
MNLSMGKGSVAERGKKLPQEEPGRNQKDQRYAQQQGHLKQRLPTTERIGRNQITRRVLPGRWLLAPLASLCSRICQGSLPNEG